MAHYTIIIAIPKTTYDNYTDLSNKKDVGIEEVLTITEPYYGDNDEMIYTLSPRHVLGYFNIKTTGFYQNRNWDPFFKNSQTRPSGKKRIENEKGDRYTTPIPFSIRNEN